MMRALAIFTLAACSSAPPVDVAPKENLAVAMARAVNASWVCTPLYTDEGDKRMHSAICVTGAGPSYCQIDIATGPACSPLKGKE